MHSETWPTPSGDRLAGRLPVHDGDRFFVSLPAQSVEDVTATGIRATLLEPVLEAIGFSAGPPGLSMPPETGVPQIQADVRSIAAKIATEVDRHPPHQRERINTMLDVLLGHSVSDPSAEAAFEIITGMTSADLVANLERPGIDYVFRQMVDSVPIEHAGLIASRRESQSITTIRGALFDQFTVTNRPELDSSTAARMAMRALATRRGVAGIISTGNEDPPAQLLLPYSVTSSGSTELRHTYRMRLRVALIGGREGDVQAWVDAQSGDLLKLSPLFGDFNDAEGLAFDVDPGSGSVLTRTFEVDALPSGIANLQKAGVMTQVDQYGDGTFGVDEVSVMFGHPAYPPPTTAFVDFDVSPINDSANATCESGGNNLFQQVHVFANIHESHSQALALGVYTPFPGTLGLSGDPPTPWNPRTEFSSGANSDMWFGVGGGYTNALCPNYSNGTTSIAANALNLGLDDTIIGHEMGHNVVKRLTESRPTDWCGVYPCMSSTGWTKFHDLADFWGDLYSNTNCAGGYTMKNLRGVNGSLNCINHDEEGGGPRLHEVTTPFDRTNPGDHFPEHRFSGRTGDYADGQIIAAALWQVMIGMNSLDPVTGKDQFATRLTRALKNTGINGFSPADSDTDRFRQMGELLEEMLDEWALALGTTNTTNKLMSGFARAGKFLIPWQCIDGDIATTDAVACPAPYGENGADAVIDVDDNDLMDDVMDYTATWPEVDYIELSGPPPTFYVWTGPRYLLDGASGSATIPAVSRCNPDYQVELSNDPMFSLVESSGWLTVDRTTSNAIPDCWDEWTPTTTQWTNLTAGGHGAHVYYRVWTRDGPGNLDRWSYLPGVGLHTVDAPFVVLTTDGLPL